MPWTCRVCYKSEAGFFGCSDPECPSNKTESKKIILSCEHKNIRTLSFDLTWCRDCGALRELNLNSNDLSWNLPNSPTFILDKKKQKEISAILSNACQIIDSPVDMPMSDWDKEQRIFLGLLADDFCKGKFSKVSDRVDLEGLIEFLEEVRDRARSGEAVADMIDEEILKIKGDLHG